MTGSAGLAALSGGVQLGGPEVPSAGRGKSIANLYSPEQRLASISFLTSAHLVPAMHAATSTGVWGFESAAGKMVLSRGVRDCLIEHENAIRWMYQKYSTDILSQPTRSAGEVELAAKNLKLASVRAPPAPLPADRMVDPESSAHDTSHSGKANQSASLQAGATPSIAKFFANGPPKTPGGRQSMTTAYLSKSRGKPDILGRDDYIPPAPHAEPRLLQYTGVLELC